MKKRSMHPGFPILLRRSLERGTLRRERFRFVRSLFARDGALVLGFAIAVGLLVLLTGVR